jgi:hypothetical protein
VLAAALAPAHGALADWIGVGAALAVLGGLMILLAAVLRVKPVADVSAVPSGMAGLDRVGSYNEVQESS